MTKATEIPNIRVHVAVDVPVGGTVFPFSPGDHATTEAIADAIERAGKGERLTARGERLKLAQDAAAQDGTVDDLIGHADE